MWALLLALWQIQISETVIGDLVQKSLYIPNRLFRRTPLPRIGASPLSKGPTFSFGSLWLCPRVSSTVTCHYPSFRPPFAPKRLFIKCRSDHRFFPPSLCSSDASTRVARGLPIRPRSASSSLSSSSWVSFLSVVNVFVLLKTSHETGTDIFPFCDVSGEGWHPIYHDFW